MCKPNEPPKGGWLFASATVVVTFAVAKIDTVTADVICMAVTAYALMLDYRHSKHQ